MLEQVLKYRGDIRRDLLWRVLGPDQAGGHVRVVEVDYLPEFDTTTARVEPVTADWITEHLTVDEHRQMWALPQPADADV